MVAVSVRKAVAVNISGGFFLSRGPMNYQAFTNDSLTMMYEGVRGALAADDALKLQELETRFRVRETTGRKIRRSFHSSDAPSTPAMVQSPVLSHGGQIFSAGMLVNQAEDECQHVRTPLFDRGFGYQASVSGCLRGRRKMASSMRPNRFAGGRPAKPLHGTAIRRPADARRGGLFRGVGDLMLQMAGLMVAPKLT
jgi:hypothetical protein